MVMMILVMVMTLIDILVVMRYISCVVGRLRC